MTTVTIPERVMTNKEGC